MAGAFNKDNQEAFNYGALEEFGLRDDHFEEEGQIISRETIEKSIDGGVITANGGENKSESKMNEIREFEKAL